MNRPMKFGIELEVATTKSKREIKIALSEAGIESEGAAYGSAVSSTWKIQNDGSLANGKELVSPPLNSLDEVKKVAHVLRKDLRVRCNKFTGMHVHHDVSDLTAAQLKTVFNLYAKYEMTAIASLLDSSRVNNTYSRPTKGLVSQMENLDTIQELADLVQVRGISRYHSLSLNPYVKYGTIEFRQHQGTTQWKEIELWIMLSHRMIEVSASEQGLNVQELTGDETPVEALELFLKEIRVEDPAQITRIKKRQIQVKKYNDSKSAS